MHISQAGRAADPHDSLYISARNTNVSLSDEATLFFLLAVATVVTGGTERPCARDAVPLVGVDNPRAQCCAAAAPDAARCCCSSTVIFCQHGGRFAGCGDDNAFHTGHGALCASIPCHEVELLTRVDRVHESNFHPGAPACAFLWVKVGLGLAKTVTCTHAPSCKLLLASSFGSFQYPSNGSLPWPGFTVASHARLLDISNVFNTNNLFLIHIRNDTFNIIHIMLCNNFYVSA